MTTFHKAGLPPASDNAFYLILAWPLMIASIPAKKRWQEWLAFIAEIVVVLGMIVLGYHYLSVVFWVGLAFLALHILLGLAIYGFDRWVDGQS